MSEESDGIEMSVRHGVPGGATAIRPEVNVQTPLGADEAALYKPICGDPVPVPAHPQGQKVVPNALVVDPDPRNRQILIEIFQKMGFQVYEASDGGAALKILTQIPVDLMTTELKMTVLDGFRLIRGTRAYLNNMAVRIIALTRSTDVRDEVSALGLGCDGFLQKPLDRHRIPAHVRNLFRMKRV